MLFAGWILFDTIICYVSVHIRYCICVFQSEADILLRPELEDIRAANPNFKLWYTLDKPPAGKGIIIHITDLSKFLHIRISLFPLTNQW